MAEHVNPCWSDATAAGGGWVALMATAFSKVVRSKWTWWNPKLLLLHRTIPRLRLPGCSWPDKDQRRPRVFVRTAPSGDCEAYR